MTHYQRIAAGECIRLIGLLTTSAIPQAKALAIIVATRLVAIVDSRDDPETFTVREIEEWTGMARAMILEDVHADSA